MRIIKSAGINTWPPKLKDQEISAADVLRWFTEADVHKRYTVPELDICDRVAYQISKAFELSKCPPKTIISDETRYLARRYLKSLRKDFEAARTLALDPDTMLTDIIAMNAPCTERRPAEPVRELARNVATIASAAWRTAKKAPRGTDPSGALVGFVRASLAALGHELTHEQISWLLKSE